MSSSHPYDPQVVLDELRQALLKHQPQDVYQFCSYFFQEKLAYQRAQLATLAQSNPGYCDIALLPAPENVSVPVITQGLQRSRDADDDDDHDDGPPPEIDPSLAYNRGRRSSVSAESMAPTTDEEFVKVVIPKSDDQRSRIRTSIANNFLFRNLDDEQYRDVVDAMAEKPVPNHEAIIQQGDIGDYFYVVETGTFEVFVSKDGNPPMKVYQYGPGGSFGELALMYNSPRAATVKATSESVVWALDRVTFRRILMERTSRKRRLYEEFLEEVPLLVSLEPYERHKIADALDTVVFQDNEVVIQQGDVGDNFYIIESGEATVTKEENGVTRTYPSLKKGDYFGELALLNDKPRQATIRAKGRLKCATLGKKAFVRLLGPVVDIIKRNTVNYRLMDYIE
ncbi:cyclic nucleotide-binding-like protein [Dimargaris cristalligena]|uniref:cAMP-dependent protein kinase regulatory subunit n=1 Tax=Dimargaris cristalligena TaxID=215637 RepID=A0A4Q0A0V1_9FUNG|nr:cyclic nucleotide-binding-like protein [Dimargaris cristalligena]|eukprot:RKP39683.1 cyclic nucleotide-binding-like protein [Dimargaris cristalligena]